MLSFQSSCCCRRRTVIVAVVIVVVVVVRKYDNKNEFESFILVVFLRLMLSYRLISSLSS